MNSNTSSSNQQNEEIQNPLLISSFKKDILYFKEDILKDIKIIENQIKTKSKENLEKFETKFIEYDQKFEILIEKVSNLSNLISTDKIINEKVENLISFKNKFDEYITQNDIKNDLLYKDIHNAIFKYDKMFADSVFYPGIIGNLCKFKNFHEFIDYVLVNIKSLLKYKENNINDLNNYKNNIDNLSKSLQIKIDNIIKSCNEFTVYKIKDNENKFNSNLKLYDEIIYNIRLENNKYSINIKNEFENMCKEWEKVLNIKTDIFNKFDKEVKYHKDIVNSVYRKFEVYKKEFNLIKNRFMQLSEFIKDVRFRVNMGEDIKKRDVINLSKKIDFSKKQIIEEDNESLNNEQDENNKLKYNKDRRLSVNFNFLKKNFGFKRLKSIEENFNKNRSNSIKLDDYDIKNIIHENKKKESDSNELDYSLDLNSEKNDNEILKKENNKKKDNQIEEDDVKNNLNIIKSRMLKKNDKINNEMIQSKSYTLLPNLSKRKNYEKINLEKIQSIKIPNTTRNEIINNNNENKINIFFKSIDDMKISKINNYGCKNFIGNSIQILKLKNNNIKSQKKSNIGNNVIQFYNPDTIKKKNKSNLLNNNKKHIQKLEEFVKDIRVHIPNIQIYYSKNDNETPKKKNNSLKIPKSNHRTNYNYNYDNNSYLNDSLFSHRINSAQTSFIYKDNNNNSFSQDKKMTNNYYYNLMINEDLLKSPRKETNEKEYKNKFINLDNIN